MDLPVEFLLLTDPHGIREALKVSSYSSVLWEFDQWLRSEVKYNENEDAQKYRDKLREFMNENNISLD